MNFQHSKTYTLDIVYDDDGNIIRGHIAIQIEELIHRLKEVIND